MEINELNTVHSSPSTKPLLYQHRWIPTTDILGQPLAVGDAVTVFNEHFISWDGVIAEKLYTQDDDPRLKWVVIVDDVMYLFSLGTHELLKDSPTT